MASGRSGIIGRGWSFPPRFARGVASAETMTGPELIDANLRVLLLTAPGERVMLPDFGCGLHEHVFDEMNLSHQTLMTDAVRRAIVHYEPRIDLDDLDVDLSHQAEGRLLIRIEYTIRTTNSRHNLVLPYYLSEGTRS